MKELVYMSLKILMSLAIVTALVGSSLVFGVDYSYGGGGENAGYSSYTISYTGTASDYPNRYVEENEPEYGSASVGGWQIRYSGGSQREYYEDKSYSEDYISSNYDKMQWVVTPSSAESRASSNYIYPGQVYKNIGDRIDYSSYEAPRSSSYNY